MGYFLGERCIRELTDAWHHLTRNDAQKQEEAQSFALVTALLATAWSVDARQKIALHDGIEALGRRISADFRLLELTSSGFEAR